MNNILICTPLYPGSVEDSYTDNTYAIHYFARKWCEKLNVLVVKPFLVPQDYLKNKKYKLNEDFYIDNVRIINLPIIKNVFNVNCYIGSILKYINKIDFLPDLIVAHYRYGIFTGYKIAKKLNLPLITGLHDTDLKAVVNNKNIKDLIKIFNYSCGVSIRSETLKKKILEIFPFISKKVFVAYSGIKKELIEYKDFFVSKSKKAVRNTELKILTVGRLQKRRNIDLNILALSKIQNIINWSYDIVGDGEERERLQKLTDNLNMESKIKFHGMLSRHEAINRMKESNIFLMVSKPETFGIAYLEAMAKANIVIAAKGEGMDGIIKDGINGFLCEPGIEENIKNIIMNLFNEINKSHQILNNTYLTINKLTEEKAAENYLKNIKKVL